MSMNKKIDREKRFRFTKPVPGSKGSVEIAKDIDMQNQIGADDVNG